MNAPFSAALSVEPMLDALPAQLSHSAEKSRAALREKFIAESGFAEHKVTPIAGDASRRSYVRVTTPKSSYIVMDSPPEHEPMGAYIKICNFLNKQGYSAPRIIALDIEAGFLLLEDLGDEIFTNVSAQNDTQEKELYQEAVSLLAEWHTKPEMLKTTAKLDLAPYSINEYLRELALFADWFLPNVSGEHQSDMASDFLNIWRSILIKAPLADCYFVHRDFHVNNLVWLKDRKGLMRIGLLDFQDALWGDPSYDLVSLLEDARRDVSEKLAAEMKAEYLTLTGQPKKLFDERYAIIGAQRNLKIIGIFHRLNKRDGKAQYLAHLPRVWKYLENDLAHPALYPLKRWMDSTIPHHLRK